LQNSRIYFEIRNQDMIEQMNTTNQTRPPDQRLTFFLRAKQYYGYPRGLNASMIKQKKKKKGGGKSFLGSISSGASHEFP